MSGLAFAMKLGTFSLSLPKWPHSVIALCYPVSTNVALPKAWMGISSADGAVCTVKLAQ